MRKVINLFHFLRVWAHCAVVSSAGWRGDGGGLSRHQASACAWCARCIGSSGRILPSAGKDDRCDGGRQRARCTQHLCSASLCVCLHHRLVTCSYQPATACDRWGARDRSSHRRGGEAMAAAAYPGTRHQPALGVRDASGARGGFCRRRGRTTDATADGSAPDARSTYAVLAYASTCTTAW